MSAPAVEQSRSRRMAAPLAAGVAAVALVVVLHVRDPHDAGAYGTCPFLELTGRPCPGCGGLRAAHLFTHGDVAGALSTNALALGLGALGVAMWGVWALRAWRDEPLPTVRDRSLLVMLAVVLVFGVVRNTPWGADLAP